MVKLGRRRELDGAGPEERRKLYERYVAQAYDRGRAINAGHVFEVDDGSTPQTPGAGLRLAWGVSCRRRAPAEAPLH
jgi:hypothetical protein